MGGDVLSIAHVQFALDHATNVSGSELLVLVSLAEWADADGFCWPSHDSIARRARVSRRQAIRLVQNLVDKGLVKQVGRRQRSNEYVITCDIAASQQSEMSHVTSSAPDVTSGASHVTPSALTCDIAMSPEPIEPPIRTTSKNHQGERARRATQIPDVFEVTDELYGWAWSELDIQRAEVDRETAKFMDYHRAKGSTMKDWVAAWRNWMRNSVTFKRPAASNGNGRAAPVKLSNYEMSAANIAGDDDFGVRGHVFETTGRIAR